MYRNFSIFGYDLSDPTQENALTSKLGKTKKFIKEENLPENPMERKGGIDPVCLLVSEYRPVELNLRHNLPWYAVYVNYTKRGLFPPMYIITQISHLRICCCEVMRSNLAQMRGTYAFKKLSLFFPGHSDNPIPSIIGNYLWSASKKYASETNDYRHVGLVNIEDKSPAFVKAIVFHMVFRLVYLIRANLFRNQFFENWQEILTMVGVPKLKTRKRSKSCLFKIQE